MWNLQDVSYLNARGVSFAVWCQGPYEEFAPFREFMGYQVPWYSLHGVTERGVSDGWLNAYLRVGDRIFLTYATDGRGTEAIMPPLKLLDMTVYGRKEQWEDSPDGWPQPDGSVPTGGARTAARSASGPDRAPLRSVPRPMRRQSSAPLPAAV